MVDRAIADRLGVDLAAVEDLRYGDRRRWWGLTPRAPSTARATTARGGRLERIASALALIRPKRVGVVARRFDVR